MGSARNNELEPYGEVTDPRERANLLDQGLDALARYWAGEFEPLPVQRPRDGCLAVLLARAGRTVVAVDPAAASLDVARSKDTGEAVT